MISFKKYVLNKWIPFPSQNQIIESVIKDTALCATTRRSEKHRSIMVALHSRTVHEANKKTGRDNKDGSHIKSNRKGKARTKNILQGTIDRTHDLMNDLDRVEREMVKNTMLNPIVQFNQTRINESLNYFKKATEKSNN